MTRAPVDRDHSSERDAEDAPRRGRIVLRDRLARGLETTPKVVGDELYSPRRNARVLCSETGQIETERSCAGRSLELFGKRPPMPLLATETTKEEPVRRRLRIHWRDSSRIMAR